MRPRTSLAFAALFTLSACAGATSDSMEPPASVADEIGGLAGPSGGELEKAMDRRAKDEAGVMDGRKLIRTGEISVAVDDYAPFDEALGAKLNEVGGFLADTDLGHVSGRVGWATLVVRVPADRFDDLVSWTESRVEVERLDIDTADVTEQWVDIESRIGNWKKTEARLLGLLETDTADLEDVLAVERELARVRGDIEQAEGRMRVLSDRVSLATLTLRVSVRSPYSSEIEKALAARVSDTFSGSIAAMVTVAEGALLATVALAPWLVLMAVFFAVLLRFVRGIRRRRATA